LRRRPLDVFPFYSMILFLWSSVLSAPRDNTLGAAHRAGWPREQADLRQIILCARAKCLCLA
jgi:hypothetical protein